MRVVLAVDGSHGSVDDREHDGDRPPRLSASKSPHFARTAGHAAVRRGTGAGDHGRDERRRYRFSRSRSLPANTNWCSRRRTADHWRRRHRQRRPAPAVVRCRAWEWSSADPAMTRMRRALRDFWAEVGEPFPTLRAPRRRATTRQRAAAVHRTSSAARRPADSQDRSLGRGEEHAHPRVGGGARRAAIRRRHFRADRRPGAGAFAGGPEPLRCRAAADVRALPFRDASFDAIYSMGTIEHFDETEQAVARDRARAQAGRPRHRRRAEPARSVSAAAARQPRCRPSACTATATRSRIRGGRCGRCSSAPGSTSWPRPRSSSCPAGCGCSTSRVTRGAGRCPVITGALVWPFVCLDRHVPAVRRHGYLLATVVTKPSPLTPEG